MLKNDGHIIEEVTVLNGEIVDDTVLEKKAWAGNVAQMVAKGFGPASKAGQYMLSGAGKQLVQRVGTGMAIGAAGGALTAKEGERFGGAMKGALLGGTLGGGVHAFQSGALARFGMNPGNSVESALGARTQMSLGGKPLAQHSLAHQMQARSILRDASKAETLASGAGLQTAREANLNTTLSRGLRRSSAGHAFSNDMRQLLPHVEGPNKQILEHINSRVHGLGTGELGRWSGSEGLSFGTRLKGLVGGKTYIQGKQIEAGKAIYSGASEGVHAGLMEGLHSRYDALMGSVNKAQAAKAAVAAPTMSAPATTHLGGRATFVASATRITPPPTKAPQRFTTGGFVPGQTTHAQTFGA